MIYLLITLMFYVVNKPGSGEFGVVWLAEAVGISSFHPRDILREKENQRRFSSFKRNYAETLLKLQLRKPKV